jgi:hypothetical protein
MRRHPDSTTGLQLCVHCKSDYVVPVDWEPAGAAGEERWWMFLRCGECGMSRDVTVSDEVAQRYDAELQHSAAPIARAADRLERERVAAEG